MIGRRQFAVTGLSAAALAALGANAFAQGQGGRRDRDHSRMAMFQKCAEACGRCQRECDGCSTHCMEHVADGHKHHLETLQTCRDCADICSTAAEITARAGVFSDLICQACAEACARCAKACEQHGRDDKVMQKCADECRRCEKVCRDMLSHDH